MRAFVITGPGAAEVREVEPPVAGPGEVVVDVERAGVCGTDVEFYSGVMAYLHTGQAAFPLRIGHEWVGRVASTGPGVEPGWEGRRVTGDTMLGCGSCDRCRSGRQHLCAARHEIGIRGGWPGALAEQLPVPATALHVVPDIVDPTMGAMIEPGANALRAVLAAHADAGERLLVLGNGTIGLLVAMIGRAMDLEVHVLGEREDSAEFTRSLGFRHTWTERTLPDLRWDAVVDASSGSSLPALASRVVEPGRRVVYLGISGEPSTIDTRELVFKDATAVGILSGSGGTAQAIHLYGIGAVDPRPLVAATVGLEQVEAVLAHRRDPAWGAAPKVLVDPRR